MNCPHCHQSVAAWADFCPHCGARQQQITGSPASPPAPTGPTGPSLTEEVFASPGTPLETTLPGVQSWDEPWVESAPPTQADAPGVSARRAGGAAGRWIVVLAGALVVMAVVFAAWSMTQVGEKSGTSGSNAVGAQSSRAGGSSGPSGASSPSGSSGAATAGAVPSAATSCGTSGAGNASAVFAGDNTSCEFALAVATAYAAVIVSANGEATVEARSPVTNKAYELVCRGALPTVCRTGNATVYLTSP